MEQFRVACELVRNGRIGDLKSIEIRLPGDPFGGNTEEMTVPKWFNYEAWLGSTPYVYYTVDRVHPQQGYDRPGWLRCEQFGAGMITGWGVHHFDIAHWAMDKEYSGPVEISGKAEFPQPGSGLWDVHGRYETRMVYDNGVIVTGVTDTAEKPNGVLFTGSEGWIFVSRGSYAASPNEPISTKSQALQASDVKILSPLTENDPVRLYKSSDHHGNWLECIRTRQLNITPAEVAHRSCSACLLQHIAMKLNRTLYWDPILERFKNDDEANSMIARPQRPPYNF
jgi:predicted dehydrogenase